MKLNTDVNILLENVAGIPLSDYLSTCKRIGITPPRMCIDTAHISAGGDKLEDIPNGVGFIHLNGNQTEPGSKSDKHTECNSKQDTCFTSKDMLKEFVKKFSDAVLILERRHEDDK